MSDFMFGTFDEFNEAHVARLLRLQRLHARMKRTDAVIRAALEDGEVCAADVLRREALDRAFARGLLSYDRDAGLEAWLYVMREADAA